MASSVSGNDFDADEYNSGAASISAVNASGTLNEENIRTSFGEAEGNFRVIEINATNPNHGSNDENENNVD